MRFKRILWSGLFSLALIVSPFIAKSALALTFDPSFGVTLASNTPSANSNVTLATTQPAGDEVLAKIKFTSPIGWGFASGSSLPQDADVATGSLTAFVVEVGSNVTVPVTIRNDVDLQGHKAHWKVLFGNPSAPSVTLDSFLDGSLATGHTFTIERAFLFTLQSPASFSFLFNGTVGGLPVITNPTIQGDYTWSVEYTAPSGAVVPRSQTLSIPGSATPAGTDVTANFNNGSSVTFSDVSTGGVTTIASSTTPPPEGSGQFQLSGGLYYDYNTTATFSCPCTVTIPYDPVATPDPRIYHQESGVWVDVTTNVDTVNHLVTGVVSSFSFFAAGQPNFGLEFLNPISALLKKSDPMELKKHQKLPVHFTLTDANGNFVLSDDVSIQILRTTDNGLVSQIPAESKHKRYEAKLELKDLNLTEGTVYKIRVKVGNTVNSPMPLFILK